MPFTHPNGIKKFIKACSRRSAHLETAQKNFGADHSNRFCCMVLVISLMIILVGKIKRSNKEPKGLVLFLCEIPLMLCCDDSDSICTIRQCVFSPRPSRPEG